MTDKEFKHLSRAQLIEVIYQLQLQIEKANEEKQELEKQLADKRLRLNKVGNIAEAALEMNDCFRNAQNAAEQYLNEIRAIREQTQAERKRILARAQAKAKAILAGAKNTRDNFEGATEAEGKSAEQNPFDGG